MMVDQNQTSSFIPKQGAVSTRRARRESSLGLLFLISLLLLGISLLVFAGSFGYRAVLDRQVNKPCGGDGSACGLKATVDRTREELGIEEIIRYSRLDKKMTAAAGLIDRHISLVPLLDLIETETLHTVRFSAMVLNVDGGVTLEGVATSYADLASQVKTLEKNPGVKAVVFSDVDLNDAGQVVFTAKLLPNSDLLVFNTN